MTGFWRRIEEDLKKWRQSDARKPLVLRGARQTGKTTLVKKIGASFDTFVYLNLDEPNDWKLFDNSLNVRDLVQYIFLEKGVKKSGETLIFIDEIQNSANAVKMLRYFYEEMPELYVIGAGSLLEIMMDMNKISFPVGRVQYLYLYPMTFEEFLCAAGETELLRFYRTVPVPEIAHDKLLKMFRLYMFVGGMPEAVSTYIKTRDLSESAHIYSDLMTAFKDDVGKYAHSRHEADIIRYVIDAVPAQTPERISFANFGNSGFGSKDVGNALRTLERAMLLYLRYPVTNSELPIVPDMKLKPHLQFLDSGLLCASVGIETMYFSDVPLSEIYFGKLAEQITGQELLASERPNELTKPLFWTKEKKQSNAEVDFIRIYKGKLYPIEVKSGASGRLRSLHSYINNSDCTAAIRLYSGTFSLETQKTPLVNSEGGKEFKLLNLPLYCAANINAYIEKFLS